MDPRPDRSENKITSRQILDAAVLLLRYPILVFSILLALFLARSMLDVRFGSVESIGSDGVKFRDNTAEFASNATSQIVELAAKIDTLESEMKSLKIPGKKGNSDNTPPVVGDGTATAPTLSDPLANLVVSSERLAGAEQVKAAYINIGIYGGDQLGWLDTNLIDRKTGGALVRPPSEMKPGDLFVADDNLIAEPALLGGTLMERIKETARYTLLGPTRIIRRGTVLKLLEPPTVHSSMFTSNVLAKFYVVNVTE